MASALAVTTEQVVASEHPNREFFLNALERMEECRALVVSKDPCGAEIASLFTELQRSVTARHRAADSAATPCAEALFPPSAYVSDEAREARRLVLPWLRDLYSSGARAAQ